jgi:hypothetical protein
LGENEKTSDRHGKIMGVSDVDAELDARLGRASQEVLDIIKEIALKMEEKLGASTTWRGFRMDELLLQQIRDMIVTHLQDYPIEFETLLTEENDPTLAAAFRSVLASVTEVVANVTRQYEVPVDVVFARIIHNMIANLIMGYAKIKMDYSMSRGT